MSLNSWKDFNELQRYAESFGIPLYNGDICNLSSELSVEGRIIRNRLLIQPVEGADADSYGRPTEPTERRYLRYAKGGAGTIWMEAVALNHDLRSNERQLVLDKNTVDSFAGMVENIKETALKENGYAPIIIIQLSHPGRSCLIPKPATDREIWDHIADSKGQKTASDDEIAKLADTYGYVALLAQEAGIDGVEVKACHRYFINELLSAHNRQGRYGGSFENRVRHLKECISSVRAEAKDVFVTVRLNHYDGIPYPDGFGMSTDMSVMPDGNEPLRLIQELHDEYGIELINCSSSSPVFELFTEDDAKNALFSKPMNPVKVGGTMHRFAREIKQSIGEVKVVATMFSQLRQYAAPIGAGMIERGEADLIGFGRQALAYPDFANDILSGKGLDKDKVCICCGGCNRLISKDKGVGCIVYDELYKV